MQAAQFSQQPIEQQGDIPHWADELPAGTWLERAAFEELPYTFERFANPAHSGAGSL
ncbi:hypothetical protein AB4Z48_10350 [Cupriavidus sp. 2TAF22]|uniref:hypothetical protein n=1 Tax=unclassified Cupriavidus TaxID=2640874 RepID=UPI003F9139BE